MNEIGEPTVKLAAGAIKDEARLPGVRGQRSSPSHRKEPAFAAALPVAGRHFGALARG